jgi:hypothetical protein
MEDRFKFRAWNEIKKKMIYGPRDGNDSPSWILALPIEDKFKMQCTGLKDKNGKLIYEGDIIHKTSQKGEGYLKEGMSVKHVIVFGNANPEWKDLTDFLGFWAVPLSLYLKGNIEEGGGSIQHMVKAEKKNPSIVIGNIYENPELLTEEEAE